MIGPTVRERLIVDHVRTTKGEHQAAQLRDAFNTWMHPPLSIAWGAAAYATRHNGLPRRAPNANAVPWAHLAKALDRI